MSDITQLPINQPDNLFVTAGENTINFYNVDPSQICIVDIARGISRINRYCGQTKTQHGYNLALHCLWLSAYLYLRTGDPKIALHGLLYDAPAAYMGDMPEQLKIMPGMHHFMKIENGLRQGIHKGLGLSRFNNTVERLVIEAKKQAADKEVELTKIGTGGSLDEYAKQTPLLFPRPEVMCFVLFIERHNDLVDRIHTQQH